MMKQMEREENRVLLVHQLKNSQKTGNGTIFVYSLEEKCRVSYGTMYRRCMNLALRLSEKGVSAGEQIIIDCTKLESQLYLFWSCAMIGCIPVFVAHKEAGIPPILTEKLGKYRTIIDYMVENAEDTNEIINISEYDLSQEADEAQDEMFLKSATAMNETCCILLSSGTTSEMKLVPLTGNNIMAVIDGQRALTGISVDSRMLGWLPFHHCAGMILYYLCAAFTGCDIYAIPTEVYSSNPILWLQCLSKYRITFSGSISSAMRNLLRRYEVSEVGPLDLSALQMVIVGAESVSTQLCYDFERTFEAYGMPKNAVVPLYGLTETASAIGGSLHTGPFECYKPEAGHMCLGVRVVPAESTDTDAYLVYTMWKGVQTKITDIDGAVLGDYHVGHLWLKGNMVIDQYYTDRDCYKTLFHDGWFFTGDIGFRTAEGRIAVVGRARDLLKIDGEFYSAQAIENAVKAIKSHWVEDVFVAEYKDDGGVDCIGIFVVCPQWMESPSFLAEFRRYSNSIRYNLAEKIGSISCQILPIAYAPQTDSKKIKRFALGELVNKALQERLMEISTTRNRDLNIESVCQKIAQIIEDAARLKISDYDGVFSNYGIVSQNIPLVIDQINQMYQTNISVASMYNFPTIRTLAEYIMETVTKGGSVSHEESENAVLTTDEDIAIVGMSNRFPGGSNTPEQFWEFLMSGADGIVDIPKERWDGDKYYSADDDEPGRMYCKKGGFINMPIDQMDASFFSVSPKEAASIDPNQRILLELTWEAFENGGLDISAYSGTKTGVFLGLSGDEYSLSSVNSGDLTKINSYSMTGICSSTACGRISYTFGFQGPCFAVDTACSSFLTALHLASVSLKNHDADCAVVGSASLMLTPVISIYFSKLKALSHDGHCKTFDDAADGYGRGEGAGVIILKRLSDAERDHDNILGVIRGTGINQDGKSNGLTAPNGESQCKIIRDTLNRAGLKKTDIDYVEAHGTGTSLGDPIEVNAIRTSYCDGVDRQHPLYIGSVKSNIGHLEAASGAASLIKVLLSLHHEMIPGNRNFNNPSTKIDWTDDIRVVASNTPWPKSERIRRASINGFGFGGSNAHAIIEEYKKPELPKQEYSGPYLLKISAKNKDSLRSLVMKYAARIREAREEDIGAIIHTANIGRVDFPCRVAVTGENKHDIETALTAYIAGKKAIGLHIQDEDKHDKKIAFMFTGQSSQYVNMARSLFENNEVFREAFMHCDDLFKPYILYSLTDLVYDENANAETIEKTVYAQPLIFTVEYALTQFWASVGIRPSLVLGHSIGEYAAAVAAEIMDLETAVKLVALRGRLMNDAPGKGTMVTLFTDRGNTQRLIGEYSSTVNIAVHNSHELCVISGAENDVLSVVRRANQEGIRTRRLNVSHGFHSELMRPAAAQFYNLANNNNTYMPAKITFMSAMFGRALSEGEVINTVYWADHICNEVKFVETITAIDHVEDYIFLEIGATNTLTSLCKYIFDNRCKYVNSLSVKTRDADALNNAAAEMYVQGATLNWNTFYVGQQTELRRVTDLPTYPFNRSRYLNEMYYDRVQNVQLQGMQIHSLLGQRIESPVMKDTVIFQNVYTSELPYFMEEHVIFDTAIAPAAAYVALVISAMKEICSPTSITIKEVELRAPLAVTNKRKVQICISGLSSGEASYQILSSPINEEKEEWTLHTQGKVVVQNCHLEAPIRGEVQDWQMLEFEKSETGEHAIYPAMTNAGFKLGEGFRRLKKSWRAGNEGIFFVEPDKNLPVKEKYVIYPGVIDSVFHTMLCMVLESAFASVGQKKAQTLIPYFIGEFSFDYQAFDDLWAKAESHIENDSIVGECYAYNTKNQPVIVIRNMIARLTNQESLLGAQSAESERSFYHYAWSKADMSASGHSDYASICFICDDENELAGLEKYSPVPMRRVIYQDAVSALADTMDLPKPTLYLFGCGGNGERDAYATMKALFDLIVAADYFSPNRGDYLRIVTKNAVPFENKNSNLAQAMLWGFAKSFAIECSGNFCGIIDVDHGTNIRDLVDVILYGNLAELCVRNGCLYSSYLQRHTDYLRTASDKLRTIILDPEATYVVSGGTGAVGQAYIGALAQSGAKHFAVLSRHEPKESFMRRMEQFGADARCFQCDVADESSVNAAIGSIVEQMPQIKGVLNVSGIFKDKMFRDMSWKDFTDVMDPKVKGSLNLYQATRECPLDFFHMTSSITAILGNMGQTNYGAANYFMNCLAEEISGNGVSGSVICWGPWAGSDVIATQSVTQNMEMAGLRPYKEEEGQRILTDFFARYTGSVMAVSADWDSLAMNMENNYINQLLKRLTNRTAKVQKQHNQENFLALITDMTKKEVHRLLTDRIKMICREVMGYSDTDEVNEDMSFKELGADSLMIFSMRNALNSMLKCEIGVSDFYNYATIRKLVDHILNDILLVETEQVEESSDINSLASELDSLLV